VIDFLRSIKDFLEIYTWTEFWTIMIVPFGIMGIWFLFDFELNIQNDIIRTVAVWSLIFTLTLGAATADALRKRKAELPKKPKSTRHTEK
jgi:hypothetical protein